MKEVIEKAKDFCEEHIIEIVTAIIYSGITIFSLSALGVYLKNIRLQNKLLEKVINS